MSWGARGRRIASALAAAAVVMAPLGLLGSSQALPSDPPGDRPATPQVSVRGPSVGDLARDLADRSKTRRRSAPAAGVGPGEDPNYPGLPLPRLGLGWTGTSTTGLAFVPRSSQYFQVPTVVNPIDVQFAAYGSPGQPPIPPGFSVYLGGNFNGHVKSPAGAAHPYGDYPPIRTRLLAFGILPVEATLYISQLRDANNLPIPLKLTTVVNAVTKTGDNLKGNGYLTGQVQLRLADVTVDGQPVEVGDHCQTSAPAALNLVGLGFWSRTLRNGTSIYWETDGENIVGPTPSTMLTQAESLQRYQLTTGGTLQGALTVPPFTGCTGSAGDLSPIVNSAVAGDQPTTIKQGAAQQCFGVAVQCNVPLPIPYPTTAPTG